MSDNAGAAGSGHKKANLGVFALSMIGVAAVLSLRNLPSMAEYGWASIFWIFLGLLLFLLPLALAAAELATMDPKSTGVYDWVRHANGEQSGFVATWTEWLNNLPWFPAIFSFLAATIAYAIFPGLASNKLYLFLMINALLWGLTGLNLFGERTSTAITAIGVVAGTLVPAVILSAMGIWWLAAGHPLAVQWHGARDLLPASYNLTTMVLVATVVLMFAGIEMSGFHALETKNPQRDYPRGMLIAVVIIFVATVIPTLAITFVVPQKQISLIAGLMQAFQYFFTAIGVGWLTRPMAVLVFVGAVALVSTWMIGPARGFKGPNRDGLLSPIWHRENRHGVPARVLFIQAGFGSLFSVFFLLIPGVSGAYWMLSALTTMFLCITYFLIFWAVVRLRYTEPDAERPFRVPGGKAGLWIIAGVGAVAVAYAFILGFVPPSQISTVSPYIYPWIMAIGTAVFVVPAFIYYRLKQPSWATSGARSVEAHRGGLEKGGAPAEVSAPPTDAAEEALTRRRTHRPWLAIGLACAIVLGVGVGTVSAVFSSSSSKTVKTASSASAITFARIQDELTRQGLQVVKATVSVPSAARMAGMTASERLFLSLKGTNPASASAAVDRLYIERYASPTKAELAVLMLTDTALRINLPLARAGTWSRGSYVIELRGEGPDAVTANVAAAMKNLGFN